MDRQQKRVLALREHVLSHKTKNFIQDINEAYDLALREELPNRTLDELKDIAKEKGFEGYSRLKKEELIKLIEGV